jgi:hypothetical protein
MPQSGYSFHRATMTGVARSQALHYECPSPDSNQHGC